MTYVMPNAAEAARLFRQARRRDWGVIMACHAGALCLSTLVLVGLCAPAVKDIPFVVYPHWFYWDGIGFGLVLNPVIAWLFVVGGALAPICFYRTVSYYRRGGTRALLRAGLRGRWMDRKARFGLVIRYALLPTWLAARDPRLMADFELFRPVHQPRRFGLLASLVLAISFNHWPVLTALELSFCVTPAWGITLPSWAGPCTFGPPRGEPSNMMPCRKLTIIP